MLRPKTMLRIAVGGLATDLLIAASTLAPNAPLLPQWPQFVLFSLIFVVHLSSVLRMSSGSGRPKWRELRSGLPRGIFIAFIVFFVVASRVLIVSVGQIGGQPTMSGGHYYLNDHGDFIPVTRAAYRHALVLQQRIFTLGPALFFAFGVLVHWPRRRPQSGIDGLQGGPVPARPL